ncbi:MAG: bifunctional 4-hydroxy-2-oxoglutarate aldolase/2-dehydro-3-deoxy-phosphogluconate aldolase [Gemmatimonadetes bacterium]|nr:bifunctional 4-hydroxy-2-oxoglutarate aldolase/2-dehydro-3-deoxy-phosphogluconate aldolase [Gemmatimonadota bacterium]MYD24563.1 bifunctional 4-hydroxy-2-oxoglutarate aldolase/2-dehydro-3-deoxy-phosphogluconate aldolase [Gemmatimonadota bacterium]MYJ00260.1 bifunctional 4-hydroxy-2-oxoglutarate aldolase/2-dehydro-3-deoxy-phosphogluconate aldolase [Gemmatimonadota bacterium]
MSSRSENLASIKACGVVAVLRADRPDALVQVAQAIGRGGIGAVEITMTTPGALNAIGECANRLGDEILLGAGTVLDPESARAAILAGAEYIVTPTLSPDVITLCRRYDKVIIPGALTPTEILTAWECGADIVKVFPATAVGPRYFKDLKAPLPQIDLIPTGGVDLDNAGDFIRAGACAVAVGGNLIDKAAVAAGEWQVLTDTARKYVDTVRNARQEGGG